MARFITVTVGCDWDGCDQLAAEDEGTIVPMAVAIDGKQGREFLLCKTHRDTVDEILLPLMQKGLKVETAPAKRASSSRATPPPVPGTPEADSLVCKAEGCDRHGRPLHNRTGMAQHVTKAHGYDNLAAYEAVHGTVVNPPKPPVTT